MSLTMEQRNQRLEEIGNADTPEERKAIRQKYNRLYDSQKKKEPGIMFNNYSRPKTTKLTSILDGKTKAERERIINAQMQELQRHLNAGPKPTAEAQLLRWGIVPTMQGFRQHNAVPITPSTTPSEPKPDPRVKTYGNAPGIRKCPPPPPKR